jgi:hypothetical protein
VDAALAELTVLTVQIKMHVSVTLATFFPTMYVFLLNNVPSTQLMILTKASVSATLTANMSSMVTARLVPVTLPGMVLHVSATQDSINNPMASVLLTASMLPSMESPVSAGLGISISAESVSYVTPTVSTAAPLKLVSATKDTIPQDPLNVPLAMAAAELALDQQPINAYHVMLEIPVIVSVLIPALPASF